jgi:hypothetical protein
MSSISANIQDRHVTRDELLERMTEEDVQLAQAALTRRWLALRIPQGMRRRMDRPKHPEKCLCGCGGALPVYRGGRGHPIWYLPNHGRARSRPGVADAAPQSTEANPGAR